jgi:hypothetical protein
MSQFEAGQVWTYRTRPGEEASRITVLQVDWDLDHGGIIHVWIEGVALKSPHVRTGIVNTVGHMPLSDEALSGSVLALVSSDVPLPSYQEGYAKWRAAFDEGKAGVWTISVAECLQGLEEALNQAEG